MRIRSSPESVRGKAQVVVDRLLYEVDEVSSLPIPASGKAYSRIRGMRGLRNKQQLYINMSRDLGNRGKSTMGFPNREGSAFTGPKHEGNNNWLVRTSRGRKIINIDPAIHSVSMGRLLDKATGRVIGKILYQASEEPPPSPSPAAECLERHHTEKTTFGGGKYGKGVDPKGKTSGKFKMPKNWKVGHAMKM